MGRLSAYRLFGYASLVLDDGGAGTPARLPGYRRVWGVATDNVRSIPGYKMYLRRPEGTRPAVYVAFVDLEPHDGSAVNGLVRPVSEAELERLDRRERNYDRVEVTGQIEGFDGRVFTYVGSAAGRERLRRGRAEGRAVVSRDYLAKVLAGFDRLGVDERRAFDDSSLLDGLPVLDLERVDLPGDPPLAGAGRMSASAAAWHDVECASYAADLGVWRKLAASSGGRVLDLGCGTGRVALDLAACGHAVTGVDSDPELVRVLVERGGVRALAVEAVAADVRSLDLGAAYPLAIAPMQVVQLLGGAAGRAGMLASVLAHLEPAGLLALALADPFEGVPAGEALPPLPDVLETGGWVLSSTPVDVRDEGDAVTIVRHRQAVSPAGELTEEMGAISLDSVSPTQLQEEAATAGYRVLKPRSVSATRDYVGSTIVMLEAPR